MAIEYELQLKKALYSQLDKWPEIRDALNFSDWDMRRLSEGMLCLRPAQVELICKILDINPNSLFDPRPYSN